MLSTHDYIGDITDEQKSRCEQTRAMFKELETLLLSFISDPIERGFSDRCIAIAKTHLETASMYVIKAIVFEGKSVR